MENSAYHLWLSEIVSRSSMLNTVCTQGLTKRLLVAEVINLKELFHLSMKHNHFVNEIIF